LTVLIALVAGGLLGAWIVGSLDSTRAQSPEPAESADAELEKLRREHEAERASWAERERELLARISALDLELVGITEESLRREQQFLSINESYTALASSEAPRELVEAMMGLEPEPEPEPPPEPGPAELYRIERSKEIGRALRNLLLVEGVDSLVLLESGLVENGFIGPVVCRLVDERGRPVGSLSAERLRLEASRAGRTLTIVLEEGYERRGGEKIPFEDGEPGALRSGTRRILLQQVDPDPWIERAPELFGPESLAPLVDDGRWHVFLVHRRLNELLESDPASGYWRISGLGGVVDDVLRTVELENLDRNGHLVRRLLADRMTIELTDKGVLLRLEDGVQLTGGRKHAFLDGRYRIFLPSADQEIWSAAGLPGLVEAKESTLGTHRTPPGARQR